MNEEERKMAEQVRDALAKYACVPSSDLQAYLLLQILEKLESIESDLASMSADSWSDHHER